MKTRILILNLLVVLFVKFGYGQIDFSITATNFATNTISVNQNTLMTTSIDISENVPNGSIGDGCIQIEISLPSNLLYVPNGGAAAVDLTNGIGGNFDWTYSSVDNLLTGVSNVAFVDGDGGPLFITVKGNLVGGAVSNINISQPPTAPFSCNNNDSDTDDDSASTTALSVSSPVLPVKLTGFSAISVDCKTNRLSWETRSEVNNKGFKIEKSKNGYRFEEIGFVKSNHNSTKLNEYSFLDQDIDEDGIYYYRLAIEDFDGKIDFSDVVYTKRTCERNFEMMISPNPASDKLNIVFEGLKAEESSVTIYDNLGKKIAIWKVNTGEKNEFIVKDLPTGPYKVVYENEGKFYTKTFIRVN
jgi:hypothetical protein